MTYLVESAGEMDIR